MNRGLGLERLKRRKGKRMTNEEMKERIARDVTVRSQLRQQRRRQLKLKNNHGRGKHRVLAIKCVLCQDVKDLLLRIGK